MCVPSVDRVLLADRDFLRRAHAAQKIRHTAQVLALLLISSAVFFSAYFKKPSLISRPKLYLKSAARLRITSPVPDPTSTKEHLLGMYAGRRGGGEVVK